MPRRAAPEAEPSTGRSRYVATCQQLLVLAAVCAALIPAASVVNLDVVHEPTTGGSALVVTVGEAAGHALRGRDGVQPVGAGADDQHH